MVNVWNQIKSFISVVWFPFFIIIIFIFLIHKISGYQDPETIRIVLGIMLGVALGFVADILKRSLDQYNLDRNLKKNAFRLLRADAEKVYGSMEMLKSALDNIGMAPIEVQEALKTSLPPLFELKYWDRLSQNDNFLLLGSVSPFNEIFNDLWELEKINSLIKLAKQQDKQAYMFAMAIYRTAMEERHHEKLLSKFMEPGKLEDFKKNWKKIKDKKA